MTPGRQQRWKILPCARNGKLKPTTHQPTNHYASRYLAKETPLPADAGCAVIGADEPRPCGLMGIGCWRHPATYGLQHRTCAEMLLCPSTNPQKQLRPTWLHVRRRAMNPPTAGLGQW